MPKPYKGPPGGADALASLPELAPYAPSATELADFGKDRRQGNGRPIDPSSVPSRLRALAVGGFHVFTQYQRSSQLSPAIQAAKATGATFTCSRELNLVDGECVGVRVTRLT